MLPWRCGPLPRRTRCARPNGESASSDAARLRLQRSAEREVRQRRPPSQESFFHYRKSSVGLLACPFGGAAFIRKGQARRPTLLPPVRPNHLLRLSQRFGSELLPTQHPPDLARPRRRIQLLQYCDRPPSRLLLLYAIVVIRETGDLRQVRHA